MWTQMGIQTPGPSDTCTQIPRHRDTYRQTQSNEHTDIDLDTRH